LRLLNSTTGIASAWYNNPGFSFDVNVSDGKTHQIALYALDWDNTGRGETIQIVDANNPGTILDTETISNLQNGVYLVWNIKGHVAINISRNSGANAVINGVFFGGGATASFAGSDTTTQGNWQSKYGADGYSIAGAGQSIPGYAVFSVQNQLNFVWSSNTSDVRALTNPNTGIGIAGTWYNNPTFGFDVSVVDGNVHQIGLYLLDWDGQDTRAQTIQIVDANSNVVLDTENASSFSGGTYLFWNVSGHVRINVTRTAGANAVVSGFFFK
jgi:hypothetical protein